MNQISKYSFLLATVILSFSTHAQSSSELRFSAQSWFERHVLPALKFDLRSVDSYGVSVKEPLVTLPPDLGGPQELVQVTLEARFSGWIDRAYHYTHRFRGFPDYGPVNCRFSQKLWAEIDSRTGKAQRIMSGQSARLIVACASPGTEWPDEYRARRRL